MTPTDSIWAKALEAHNDSLQHSYVALQAKFDALQSKTDLLANVVETANDGVSNQLSSATYLLEIIAIVIAIGGFVLGSCISHKMRQIKKMAQIVDEKKKVVEKLAKVVDEKKEKVDIIAKAIEILDQKIHSDLSALYKDLRNEETNALLDRLVLEPTDVSNLNDVLMSREINEEGYKKLKKAFLKLKEDQEGQEINPLGHDYFGEFVVLFFQHFFYQAIMDDDISSEFESRYDMIFSRANKRDMIKSTTDLCKALSDRDATFEKEGILVSYLKSLNLSQYNNLPELKNIFKQNITPQTLLQSAIDRCTADHVYLTLFGVTSSERDETTPQQNGKN